jgi:hypothetical protein
MKWMARTAAGLAGVGLLATVGIAGASMASADGPEDPPEQLAAEIMALDWPHYSEGDGPEHQIYAAKLLLRDQGHYEFPDDDALQEFGPDLTEAVVEFQDAHDLPDSGDLDTEVWGTLRHLYFPPLGDGRYDWYGPGDSGDIVTAIQYLLVMEYDKDLGDAGIDGRYGPATAAAVEEFQSETCTADGEECLDEDGLVGVYTWRALVTGGI